MMIGYFNIENQNFYSNKLKTIITRNDYSQLIGIPIPGTSTNKSVTKLIITKE